MAPQKSLTALLLAGAAVLTGAHNVAPNADEHFYKRHAQVLSEACQAKHGRALLQSEEQTCLLDPESVVGPYGWPSTAIRRNISEGQPGVPFELNLNVVNSTNCEPITNAAVEVWSCTWEGIYSHYEERSSQGGDREAPTSDTTYLRGVQFTDEEGRVRFNTVVPGWYPGRTLHMHVRVLFGIEAAEDGSGYTGGTSGHVGQLYFPDDWWFDTLTTLEPYTMNTIGKVPTTADLTFGYQFGPFGLMDISMANPDGEWQDGVVGSVQMGVYTEDRPNVNLVYVNITDEPRDETDGGVDTGSTTGSASGVSAAAAMVVAAALSATAAIVA